MLYLATPSGADVRAAMQAGLLACMTTPAQGNVIPPGALYACDNGKFGKGWPGEQAWFAWLTATVNRYGRGRCLWAVAPDVPMEAAATLAESLPWLEPIRALGILAAFAAQDGSEHGLIPWDAIDVLFLADGTEGETSPAAHRLAVESRERRLAIHMGRVNSRRRLRIAQAFGCASCDGTYLAFGPDTNLPRLLAWMNELRTIPTLFGDEA
ncbi:hypothetical protein [Streptomyces sp. OM5714]|uniref:hypothetical protein n=1 Tax=Streptomyces sp. OM5714 TaxID=2602736 RepID=UPI0013D96C4D|nr:hypothetical protein [Streptomyces sp. OM5714]KAF2774868.1 hypothetical protein STPH1_7055 [Streptomyces sp. OM5714]